MTAAPTGHDDPGAMIARSPRIAVSRVRSGAVVLPALPAGRCLRWSLSLRFGGKLAEHPAELDGGHENAAPDRDAR